MMPVDKQRQTDGRRKRVDLRTTLARSSQWSQHQRKFPGSKGPRNESSQELSFSGNESFRERKGPGTKVPGNFRSPRTKVPGNERSRERKVPGTFVLGERKLPFILGNERSWVRKVCNSLCPRPYFHTPSAAYVRSERATEQKFQGSKVPGKETAREQKRQGAIWPGSESARVLLADSLRGANGPRSEKARYPRVQSNAAFQNRGNSDFRAFWNVA